MKRIAIVALAAATITTASQAEDKPAPYGFLGERMIGVAYGQSRFDDSVANPGYDWDFGPIVSFGLGGDLPLNRNVTLAAAYARGTLDASVSDGISTLNIDAGMDTITGLIAYHFRPLKPMDYSIAAGIISSRVAEFDLNGIDVRDRLTVDLDDTAPTLSLSAQIELASKLFALLGASQSFGDVIDGSSASAGAGMWLVDNLAVTTRLTYDIDDDLPGWAASAHVRF